MFYINNDSMFTTRGSNDYVLLDESGKNTQYN